ncbi:MAG: hypothetical protein EOP85_19730, partial [Verrucomicrobiaceae bacterium]
MPTELPPPRGSVPPAHRVTFDESPLSNLAAGTRRCLRMAGLGRMCSWLVVAVCAIIAIDLSSVLSPVVRTAAGILILLVAAFLFIRHLWQTPRKITTEGVTREVEAAHPDFGQLLSTARDPSLSSPSVSPVLRNELYRRAGETLATLDLKRNLPRRPVRQWLVASVLALLGFLFLMTSNREAPVALKRLVAPFAGVTYTQVADTTPDRTFDRTRLPRIEATVTGRPAETVMVTIA